MRKSVSNHKRLKDIVTGRVTELSNLGIDLENTLVDIAELTPEKMRIELDYADLLKDAKQQHKAIGKLLKEHEVAVQNLKEFFTK